MPLSRRVAILLAAGLAFLPVPPGWAQTPGLTSRLIFANHDFDASSMTYCLLERDWHNGAANLNTTGSSATVDAASGTPFTPLAKGSIISVTPGSGASGAPQERYVLTTPSGSQITINTATDWSGNGSTGFPFTYRNLACGTGDGDGWFSVSDFTTKTIQLDVAQLSLASGSLSVEIDCKGASQWSKYKKVYPAATPASSGQCDQGAFTTAGATASCLIVLPFDAQWCRIGASLTDDAGDTGANLEQVTAELLGRAK